MMVGEEPGDKEDLEGRPFVGPAGSILDEALLEAGISRASVYITNAVKHFKWIPKGARRLHQKPNRSEIKACLPWLESEISVVKPDIVVCLGSTASSALIGPDFRLTQHRGEWIASRLAARILATIHPSAILRAPDGEARLEAKRGFVADLRLVAAQLERG
jgi:DNA polymerase